MIVKSVSLDSNSAIEKALADVGFDKSYLSHAALKYDFKPFKIFDLRPIEANILKQTCLSLGFDCALHKNSIDNSVDKTDVILSASSKQIHDLVKKLELQPLRLKELANELNFQLNTDLSPMKIRGSIFDWKNAKTPYLMGIVNVTEDSFSDGGKFLDSKLAIDKALELISQGADIIDLGAESTKPYSHEIPSEIEIERLSPVIEGIRKVDDVTPISIDTRHSKTANHCLSLGADIINDVSGFDLEPEILKVVKEYNCPYILMHAKGTPETMQENPSYENVVEDVYFYLHNKLAILNEQQISKVIIDIGLGFGKSVNHNFELIKNIDDFASLKCPVLVGHSRKSFISKTFPDADLDFATCIYSAYLAKKSVNILRIHEIKNHLMTMEMIGKLSNKSNPE